MSTKNSGVFRNADIGILFRPKDVKCFSDLCPWKRKKKDAFWGVYREKSNIVNFGCFSQFPRKCSSHRHYFLYPKIKEKKTHQFIVISFFHLKASFFQIEKTTNENGEKKTLRSAFFENFFFIKRRKKLWSIAFWVSGINSPGFRVLSQPLNFFPLPKNFKKSKKNNFFWLFFEIFEILEQKKNSIFFLAPSEAEI